MYVSLLVLRLPPPSFTVNDLDIHGNSVENDALDEKLESAYIMNQTPKTENATNCAWETGSNTARPSTKQPTLKEAILTPEFALIYIAFFANQLFGVIVLSRLSSMCVDIFSKSENTASDIVSINGAFNCIGRLAFSCTSDLLVRNFKMEKAFARKVLYYYTLGAQIIVIGSLPTVIRHESFTYFAIEIFVLTSSFGGGLGTVPALLTDMFGAYNAGPMQGVILTSVSIGAVGGGIIFNNSLNNIIADGMTVSEAYIDNINAIFIVVCIGFALLFLVRTNVADRLEPGYHYSLCGKRVISIPSKKKSEIKQAEVEEK
ncbi:unnamed protein product [Peronospora belbahrii]|nr:unnamed protein product [Peronospora belbahrii]